MNTWLIGILMAAASVAGAQTRPPNLIIFYTDDMGVGDLACYGAGDLRTPNIDGLADAGVRFTSYYAAAPLCSPSRVALMTGRYPPRAGHSTTQNIPSGMDAPGMPSREVTLADLARKRGYATAVFGKWHLGSIHDHQPNSRGFDEFLGHHASCVDPYSHWYYVTLPYYHDLYRDREEVFEGGTHMTDLITRETLRFIGAHRERPFLIYVSYNTPHYPMVAPPAFMREYIDLPEPRRSHAALVAAIDDSVGQVMRKLDQLNLVNDTFIFFASDNGAAAVSERAEGGGCNGPFRGYKRSLFEGGIRVPAIVTWRGRVPAGEVRDQPVIAMDLLPTFASICGADLPAGRIIDGIDWMPLLQDAGAPGHQTLFFEWAGQHAVRHGRWKLVQNGFVQQNIGRDRRAGGDDAVFLTDLQDDPGETTNLRRQHPDVAERLLTMFARWQTDVRRDASD